MKAGALAGVRVLDLADESAAFAGRILADLGAIIAGNPESCIKTLVLTRSC